MPLVKSGSRVRFPKPSHVASLLILSLLHATSCSSGVIAERYYIPGVLDGVVRSYYRVDVEGSVYGTKLRYLSGFFDERALDRYFNTFSQPDGGALLTVDRVPDDKLEELVPENETRDADPRGLGRKLVLLMSQNSEAVANQIGAIAQSDAFSTIVGRLVFKEEIAELEGVRANSDRLVALASDARSAASALALRLKQDDQEEGSTKEQLLIFVNSIAASLGGGPFGTFDKAVEWLGANQVELTEENR